MNIFVTKLSPDTTEEHLSLIFGQHGTVLSAKIIQDHETGQSKGYGFVEMENEEEGERAVQALNETEVHEHTIVVKEARPPEEYKAEKYAVRSDRPRYDDRHDRRDRYDDRGGRGGYDRRDRYDDRRGGGGGYDRGGRGGYDRGGRGGYDRGGRGGYDRGGRGGYDRGGRGGYDRGGRGGYDRGGRGGYDRNYDDRRGGGGYDRQRRRDNDEDIYRFEEFIRPSDSQS